MPVKLLSVTIDESLWNKAREEGASQAKISAARLLVRNRRRALKNRVHDVQLINGRSLEGDYHAQISLRKDGKTLQVVLLANRDEEGRPQGTSSYTGVHIVSMRRKYASLMREKTPFTAVTTGGPELMAKGPLNSLVRLATYALPSIKKPALG